MESENTSDDTLFYRAFEDKHRGSRELIKSRLQQYLPFLEPLVKLHPLGLALDLGCGRGEWLEVANEVGLSAHGVDLDPGMLAACTERGLLVEQKDAIQTLQKQHDASVCVISAFHVVEHIAFDVLQTLVREALRALVPGGLLILETPNPENLVVGTANFYLDPTHIRPIPPLLLEFLPEHYGYIRNKTLRLQESASLRKSDDLRLIEILSGVSPDYAVVAQKAALPATLQAFDAAFNQDYGLTLGNLSERYENMQCQRQEVLNTQIEAMQAQERILSEQVIPQLQQSQLDKLVLQKELLEREHTFAAQLTVLYDQYKQEQAALRQSYDVREDELKREFIALRQAMDTLRETAQLREQTLQQNLLDRERDFTAQIGEINVQHLQVQDALNQTHATHEADLKRQFTDRTETMLSQVRADAAAQIQIYEQLVDRLYEQESSLRNELAQYATYAQAQAARIGAMQSTWWWRLSMPFRHASRWAAIFAPMPVHAPAATPLGSDTPAPSGHVIPDSRTLPPPSTKINQGSHPMSIQHIIELFALEGRDFITEAYHNLLGREPDPQGMAYYLGRMAMGYGKASVIMDLARSAESLPHREIIGLEKLIVTERHANHWLWGRFSGRQHQERLLREGVMQGLAQITALMESFTERMEGLLTFAKSNQSHTTTKEQSLPSADDVRSAYREILGREPENDQVIAHHAKCESVDALRQALLRSEEFKYRINAEHLVPRHVNQVEDGEGSEVGILDPHAREIYLELKSQLLRVP